MNTYQTPRILPAHLQAFHPSQAGQHTSYTVRLLGTVTALSGNAGTLQCGHTGEVALILTSNGRLQVGKLFEVIGKVAELENGQGFGLKVLGSVEWGNPDSCDYNIYEQVVNATHLCTPIFYDVVQQSG